MLADLSSGLLKITGSTGVLSSAVAGTDYAAASHTHDASAISSGVLGASRGGTGIGSYTTGNYVRGRRSMMLPPLRRLPAKRFELPSCIALI